MNIWENKGRLYLDIYINGQRRRESLGVSLTDDKAQNKEVMAFAEICRSKRELQIAEGRWGGLDHMSAKIPLYSYMEKMAKARKKKDRVYKALPYLAGYPGGQSIQLGQVTSKWFANFQGYLEKDSGLAPQSAFNYAYAIRMALDHAVRENILPANPAKGLKGIAVPEIDRDYLTLDELRRLARVPVPGKLGAEVRRAFVFACYCALRISDIKTLAWGDVERKTNGAQIGKRMVKTGSKVFVPLHESAWKIINDGAIHHRADPVFPLLAGSLTDTNKYLIRWAARAGIGKRVTWHAARRTCPSLLHEMGVDVYTIQKICGHKRIGTTQIYTRVSDQGLRRAIDALPDIEIMEAAE